MEDLNHNTTPDFGGKTNFEDGDFATLDSTATSNDEYDYYDEDIPSSQAGIQPRTCLCARELSM